mgnify:CR=1 FL=1
METINDKHSASDLINFKSGVNLGYSLGLWKRSPEIIESVNSLIKNNPQSAFYRGVNKGYERAVLELNNEVLLGKNNRMSELSRVNKKSKDNIDLDR